MWSFYFNYLVAINLNKEFWTSKIGFAISEYDPFLLFLFKKEDNYYAVAEVSFSL